MSTPNCVCLVDKEAKVATLSPASVGTQRVGSLTHPRIAEI